MSEGFTPGPWALRRSRTGSSHTHIECPADESMALFKRAEDARLFIAAPDLLEALELLNQSAPAASCEMFHHEKQDRHTFLEECPALIRYEQACLKARAAISKARGTPC